MQQWYQTNISLSKNLVQSLVHSKCIHKAIIFRVKKWGAEVPDLAFLLTEECHNDQRDHYTPSTCMAFKKSKHSISRKSKALVKPKLWFEKVKIQDDHEKIAPHMQEPLLCSGFY